MLLRLSSRFAMLPAILLCAVFNASPGRAFDWVAQPPDVFVGFGLGLGLAADGLGNLYVSGERVEDDWDAFIQRFTTSGEYLEIIAFGDAPEKRDTAISVAADSLGNVFAAGRTRGALDGPNRGLNDAFVSSLDGAPVWIDQFGDARQDFAYDIWADGAGNAYAVGYSYSEISSSVAGYTEGFVRAYASDGTMLWHRVQSLPASPHSPGGDLFYEEIDGDAYGQLVAVGSSWEYDGQPGAWIAGDAVVDRFSREGDLLGRSYIETGRELSFATSVDVADDGSIFVAGGAYLDASFQGGSKSFAAKLNAQGETQWVVTFGGPGADGAPTAIVADGRGGAVVAATQLKSFGGPDYGLLTRISAGGEAGVTTRLAGAPWGPFQDRRTSIDGLIREGDKLFLAGLTNGLMNDSVSKEGSGLNPWVGRLPIANIPWATGVADINGDGEIDGADLAAWEFGFGSGSEGADLLIWQRAFGGAASATASVPEPNTVSWLSLASLSAATSRRRRKMK